MTVMKIGSTSLGIIVLVGVIALLVVPLATYNILNPKHDHFVRWQNHGGHDCTSFHLMRSDTRLIPGETQRMLTSRTARDAKPSGTDCVLVMPWEWKSTSFVVFNEDWSDYQDLGLPTAMKD